MINDDTYKFTRTGDGSESRYTFGFKIFEETDVKVAVINPGGSRFSLVRDTHFTVSGLGVNDGGAIQLLQDPANRYTDGNSDNLRAGWTIEISREADYDQELSIGNQQELNRSDLETALDKLTVLIQQIRRERVDWEGQWDAETTYHLGALVFYNGSLWHSLKNDNLCRVPGTTAADQPFTGDIASCEPGDGYWENLLERVDISDETLGDLSNVAKAVDSADNGLILKRVAGEWQAAMETVGGATPEQLQMAIAALNAQAGTPDIQRLDQAIEFLSERTLESLSNVGGVPTDGQVLKWDADGGPPGLGGMRPGVWRPSDEEAVSDAEIDTRFHATTNLEVIRNLFSQLIRGRNFTTRGNTVNRNEDIIQAGEAPTESGVLRPRSGQILSWLRGGSADRDGFQFIDPPISGGGGGLKVWRIGDTYNARDYVLHNREIYTCYFGTTGASDNEPGTEGGSDAWWRPGVQFYVRNRYYNRREIIFVHSSSKLYLCKNRTNTAPVQGANWDVLTPTSLGQLTNVDSDVDDAGIRSTLIYDGSEWIHGPQGVQSWNLGVAYPENTLASYFGVIYRATQAVPDTRTTSPSRDSTYWEVYGGGSGAATLAGLTDTTITNPQDGQQLVRRGSAWVNEEVRRIEIRAINGTDLQDSDIYTFLGTTKTAFEGSTGGTNYELDVRFYFPTRALATAIQRAVNTFNANTGTTANVRLNVQGSPANLIITNPLQTINVNEQSVSLRFNITKTGLTNVINNNIDSNGHGRVEIAFQTRPGSTGEFTTHVGESIFFGGSVHRDIPADWARQGNTTIQVPANLLGNAPGASAPQYDVLAPFSRIPTLRNTASITISLPAGVSSINEYSGLIIYVSTIVQNTQNSIDAWNRILRGTGVFVDDDRRDIVPLYAPLKAFEKTNITWFMTRVTRTVQNTVVQFNRARSGSDGDLSFIRLDSHSLNRANQSRMGPVAIMGIRR